MNSLNATHIKVFPRAGKWSWCLLDKFDNVIDYGAGKETKKEAQAAGVDAKDRYRKKLEKIALRAPTKTPPAHSWKRLIFERRQKQRGDLE